MENNKRLQLIKILLNYTITKNREDENFINYLNENLNSYNIDISPTISMPYDKIIKTLKPHKSQNEVEKESEKLNEVFIRKGTDIDKIIEEFCRKYDI